MLDGDTLGATLSAIYDAGLEDGCWQALLATLTRTFGATFGAVVQRSSNLRDVDAQAAGVDPAEYDTFLRRHFRNSPFHRRMPAWRTAPSSAASTICRSTSCSAPRCIRNSGGRTNCTTAFG